MFLGQTHAALPVPAERESMVRAAQRWMDLFCGKAPWLYEGGVETLNLPAAIAGELARLVTAEMKCNVTGSVRADFLDKQLGAALPQLRTQCEYALAGGGIVMKPYVQGGALGVEFVQPQSFIPLTWNVRGEVTGAAFLEQIQQGNSWYTRIERHMPNAEGYTVTQEAYVSTAQHSLGTRTELAAVPRWAELSPQLCVICADGSVPQTPLFAYFKMPFANQEDPSSPMGVSAYSRAVGLLEQADRQYTRILWEYEGSELAIDASVGAIQMEDGDMRLPRGKQRLFRELGIDKGDGGDLYSVFSPEIRDGSLFNGLNQLLKRIEFACYLSYGALSDPQNVEKTAEEVKMSRQRSYSAVCDVQKALEDALCRLLAAMQVYASLYSLAPEGDYTIAINFGDAIATDTQAEREAMRQDCLAGAAAWWEYRVRFYGETEAQARARAAQAVPQTTAISAETF